MKNENHLLNSLPSLLDDLKASFKYYDGRRVSETRQDGSETKGWKADFSEEIGRIEKFEELLKNSECGEGCGCLSESASLQEECAVFWLERSLRADSKATENLLKINELCSMARTFLFVGVPALLLCGFALGFALTLFRSFS